MKLIDKINEQIEREDCLFLDDLIKHLQEVSEYCHQCYEPATVLIGQGNPHNGNATFAGFRLELGENFQKELELKIIAHNEEY